MKLYRILPILLCLMTAGCDPAAEAENHAENAQAESVENTEKTPVSRETTVGPVRAVVTLDNAHPRLGEQIQLVLRVDAPAGVEITMPEFGDQLGRYSIAGYKSEDRLLDDGRYEHSQHYALELPMSGKLITPSFLVEFKDRRPDSEDMDKIQELLTDEISFEALSVFKDGEVPAELYPIKDTLPELVIPQTTRNHYMTWGMLALLVLAGAGILVWAARRKKAVPPVPPDVIALEALSKLRDGQIPTERKAADAWYVKLSSVVRHYLESRFSVQAPRLTTEEFLELAKKSSDLSEQHKLLLKKLLELSDRVKFSNFVPTQEESAEVLEDAWRFVHETRVTEDGSEPDGPSKT